MSRPYSEDLRFRAQERFERGESSRKVSEELSISRSTAVRWHQRYKAIGSTKAKENRGHRALKITESHSNIYNKEKYKNIRQADLTLAERVLHFAEEGLIVSVSTVWRFLKREKISYKKKTTEASEKDKQYVADRRKKWQRKKAFLNKIMKNKNIKIYYIDETWIKTNMFRLRGWGNTSERLIEKVPHGHWKTLTCVAALSQDGLEAVRVFDKAINGSSFEEYIREDICPLLKKGDLVIMDNLSSHTRKIINTLIKGKGARLWFTPPYSPDENPIENAFSKLKNTLRKVAERTVEALCEAVKTAAQFFPKSVCQNFILNAGYPVQPI
jgi:transposase